MHDALRYDVKSLSLSKGYKEIRSRLRRHVDTNRLVMDRWAKYKLLERLTARAGNGSTICEWGCHYGALAILVSARLPRATVKAFDISQVSVALGRRLNRDLGTRVELVRGDARRLPYPAASIDFAYGVGVLHHVHCRETFAELARVLRPGGTGWFVEPTAFNPLVRLYRRMRAEPYSPDETPYDEAMLAQIADWAPELAVSWNGEHLLSAFYVLGWTLIARVFGEQAQSRLPRQPFTAGMRLLGRLDDALLGRVKPLSRLCQLVTITVHKPAKPTV